MVLRNQDFVVQAVAKRFPIIIVDECQDLSSSQLQILEILMKNGCKLHFVGDLNQGIYSFRNVDPKLVEKFTSENRFVELKLTTNFRSTQTIVDFCGKLVDQIAIAGALHDTAITECYYVTFDKKEMHLLPQKFISVFLNKMNIPLDDSVILTRNNNTVIKLRPGVSSDLSKSMYLPTAIKIWKNDSLSVDQVSEALSCVGKFVANTYFPSDSTNKSFNYCPETISSHSSWRLFLANLLDICCQEPKFSNLEQSWREWAKLVREKFDDIVMASQNQLSSMNINSTEIDVNYIAPKGYSNKTVSETLQVIDIATKENIRITNFHQIKGETKKAAMVVSSPTNHGNGEGFWKNWLENKNSENARFAYVASSRPSNLLVWAVPNNLSIDDQDILNKLGLTLIKDF